MCRTVALAIPVSAAFSLDQISGTFGEMFLAVWTLSQVLDSYRKL